jgi:hypothetical protein
VPVEFVGTRSRRDTSNEPRACNSGSVWTGCAAVSACDECTRLLTRLCNASWPVTLRAGGRAAGVSAEDKLPEPRRSNSQPAIEVEASIAPVKCCVCVGTRHAAGHAILSTRGESGQRRIGNAVRIMTTLRRHIARRLRSMRTCLRADSSSWRTMLTSAINHRKSGIPCGSSAFRRGEGEQSSAARPAGPRAFPRGGPGRVRRSHRFLADKVERMLLRRWRPRWR